MLPALYPLVIFVALATCTLLLRRTQRGMPLTGREKLGIGLGAFCGAMLGAKLPFVLADWQGLASGWAWLAHGKTILSGIVGGYLGVEVAKWALDVHVKTGDTFAVPCAVAVAIGRLGCFAGGCCYGSPTHLPWGMRFPLAADPPGLLRHPAQLYEALFHLTCAVVFFWLLRRGLFKGQLIKLYILAYLAFRFVSECWRPEIPLWGGLTGYQWATLLLAPLFIWLWRRDARRFAQQGRPDYVPEHAGTPAATAIDANLG